MSAAGAGSEILTTAEMGRADSLTIAAGTPGLVLMENAGRAVATCAAAMLDDDHNRVTVLCGPGNNGGDGFVAARLLREQGFAVTVGLLGEAKALKGDAAEAARAWGGPVAPLAGPAAARLLDRADLAIDALFGAGLSRDLDGDAREAVEALNEWRRRTSRPVVAVDVPSGIDGNDGSIRGAAVEADATVTFFRRSRAICCCPVARIAGASISPTSALPAHASPSSRPDASSTVRRSGASAFRYRRLPAINISAAMRVSSLAASRMPARPG